MKFDETPLTKTQHEYWEELMRDEAGAAPDAPIHRSSHAPGGYSVGRVLLSGECAMRLREKARKERP